MSGRERNRTSFYEPRFSNAVLGFVSFVANVSTINVKSAIRGRITARSHLLDDESDFIRTPCLDFMSTVFDLDGPF